jgi:hypothetical protein
MSNSPPVDGGGWHSAGTLFVSLLASIAAREHVSQPVLAPAARTPLPSRYGLHGIEIRRSPKKKR